MPHQFMIDGDIYEWMGELYFKKINEKHKEDSFGADALVHNTVRNATIKTMGTAVHFAKLSQHNFAQGL